MMAARRALLVGAGAAIGLTLTGAAWAHHGWRWAEDENSELTGIIKAVQLGNPHGEVTVDAGGEEWIIEVGQPWRNARAGLEDRMLAPGVEITAAGHRSADPAEKRFKAERVSIDGNVYDLYPDRD